MALETFKARLKAKSTAAGAALSNVRIEALSAKLNTRHPDLTEEADHDAQIDALYDTSDFKEMKTFDDYQRAKAAKAKKDKETQQRSDEAEGDEESTDTTIEGEKPKADRTPKWAKDLISQVQTLTAERSQQTMKQKVEGHEKLKGIPKSLLALAPLPEKEEDLDAWADGIVSSYAALQAETGSVDTRGPRVAKPSTPGGVSQDVKDFVERQKQSNSNP